LVGTWKSEEQGLVVCSECGAEYKKSVTRFPMRDKDSFDCNDCGERLDSWNGTHVPTYTQVSQGNENKA